MNRVFFTSREAAIANQDGAMETGDHYKNGYSSKSLISKVGIISIMLVSTILICEAQIFIGPSLNINHRSLIDSDSKTYIQHFVIGSKFGYYFSDNFAMGASGSFTWQPSNSTSASTNTIGSNNTFAWATTAFARYNLLGTERRISFFIEGSLGYRKTNWTGRTTTTSSASTTMTTTKEIYISPVLSYNLTEKLSIEASCGVLYFGRTSSSHLPVRNNFEIGVNSPSFRIIYKFKNSTTANSNNTNNIRLSTQHGVVERIERIEIEKNETFSYFAMNYIEQEISIWTQRGEFERTVDWQERVSEDNRRAKIGELYQAAAQAFIAERSKEMPSGSITLGAYDADNEVFLIKNDLYGDWLAPVPILEALDFRNNWDNLTKTLQWEIRNDRIAFAGYKFEPVEVADADVTNNNIAEQRADQTIYSPAKQDIITGADVNKDVSSRRGETAIGVYPAIGRTHGFSGLTDFGVGGKFRYNVSNPVRLEGSFTYFLPHKVNADELLGPSSKMTLTFWDVSVNGHYLIPASSNFTIYPLAGMCIFGGKSTVSGTFMGITGSGSDSKTFVGFNIGGGFDVSITNNLFLYGELRYLTLFASDEIFRNRLTILAGIAYRWGKNTKKNKIAGLLNLIQYRNDAGDEALNKAPYE